MGLAKDIENVFLDTMGYHKMEDKVARQTIKMNAEKLGRGISKAVVKWVQKQNFNITKMKAIVQLEKLNTTGDIMADVQSQLQGQIPVGTVFVPPSGMPNILPMPITMNSLTTKRAVKIPKLRLNKKVGHGGSMEAVGYAYVGINNPISPNESNETKTTVKLVNVKDA